MVTIFQQLEMVIQTEISIISFSLMQDYETMLASSYIERQNRDHISHTKIIAL